MLRMTKILINKIKLFTRGLYTVRVVHKLPHMLSSYASHRSPAGRLEKREKPQMWHRFSKEKWY